MKTATVKSMYFIYIVTYIFHIYFHLDDVTLGLFSNRSHNV